LHCLAGKASAPLADTSLTIATAHVMSTGAASRTPSRAYSPQAKVLLRTNPWPFRDAEALPPVHEPSRRQLGSRFAPSPPTFGPSPCATRHVPSKPGSCRRRKRTPCEREGALSFTPPSCGPYGRSRFPVRLSGVSAIFLSDRGGQTLSGLHHSTETRLAGTVLWSTAPAEAFAADLIEQNPLLEQILLC